MSGIPVWGITPQEEPDGYEPDLDPLGKGLPADDWAGGAIKWDDAEADDD